MMCTLHSWPCYLITRALIPDNNRMDFLFIEVQINFLGHFNQHNLVVVQQTAKAMASAFRPRVFTPEKLNLGKISGVGCQPQLIESWRRYYQLSTPQLNLVRLNQIDHLRHGPIFHNLNFLDIRTLRKHPEARCRLGSGNLYPIPGSSKLPLFPNMNLLKLILPTIL